MFVGGISRMGLDLGKLNKTQQRITPCGDLCMDKLVHVLRVPNGAPRCGLPCEVITIVSIPHLFSLAYGEQLLDRVTDARAYTGIAKGSP